MPQALITCVAEPCSPPPPTHALFQCLQPCFRPACLTPQLLPALPSAAWHTYPSPWLAFLPPLPHLPTVLKPENILLKVTEGREEPGVLARHLLGA